MRPAHRRSLPLLAGLAAVPLVTPAHAASAALEARLAHPVLAAGERQTVLLEVGLAGRPLAQVARRPPVNLALVIDRSGSMAGDKLAHARQAAIEAVSRLRPDDVVAVVAFDHQVTVPVPATRASDRAAIHGAIARLRPGGNTAIWDGVRKAADELRKFAARGRPSRMILLSDGLANVGPSTPGELGDLGAALMEQGVAVTTLGLGLGYNEDLLVELARRSDGNHAFVERPDELAGFFAAELGDALSVIGRDARVRIRCRPGVRPLRALGREAGIGDGEITATFNQLYAGQDKRLVIELEVQGGAADAHAPLVDVEAEYLDLPAGRVERLAAAATARFAADRAEVARGADRRVLVDATRLQAAENDAEAIRLRDAGRVDEARRALQGNAAFLRSRAASLGAPELESAAAAPAAAADHLDDASWNRQRKAMKREHHREVTRQSY